MSSPFNSTPHRGACCMQRQKNFNLCIWNMYGKWYRYINTSRTTKWHKAHWLEDRIPLSYFIKLPPLSCLDHQLWRSNHGHSNIPRRLHFLQQQIRRQQHHLESKYLKNRYDNNLIYSQSYNYHVLNRNFITFRKHDFQRLWLWWDGGRKFDGCSRLW